MILACALGQPNAQGAEITLSKDDVGQLWLQIVGPINDGDDARFKTMLVDAIDRGEQITNVSIYSPGGRVIPSMQIGRYIRLMHLTTVAPQLLPFLRRHLCRLHATRGQTTMLQYDAQTSRGDARCTCAGECFLIWAAGAMRLGEAVQIRRIILQKDDYSKVPDTKNDEGQRLVTNYLREMDIPRATIARMFSLSSNIGEYLNKEETDLLGRNASPWLTEMFRARCSKHAAASAAALTCKKVVVQELYWEGAQRLLNEKF
jgi:hypothetical protein